MEGEDSLEMEKLHVESVQDELLEAFEDFGPAEMLMDSMPMLKLYLKTHSDLMFSQPMRVGV